MHSFAAKLLVPFNLIQARLTDFSKRADYFVLALVALVPILLALFFGAAFSRDWTYPTPDRLVHHYFHGYMNRVNWCSLVLFLPFTLYLVRSTARRLFDLDRNPTKRIGVPNLLRSASAAEAFRNLACDGRNLVAATLLTIFIHILDMHAEVACAWSACQHRSDLLVPPAVWDWSRFYLHQPYNDRVLVQGVILLVSAYLSQFLVVLLEMSLIILLLRHNFGYIRSSYRRQRDGSETDSRLVLNLRDPQRRFGLNALQPQFNSQITLLSIAAALSILSRTVNADTGPIHTFINRLIELKNWNPEVLFTRLLSAGGALFPTVGQVLFIVFWIAMFLIVFTPALAKLVPLRSFRYRNPSPQEFLLEFIPPDSELDRSTDSLNKEGSLEETAAKFARNAFWPSGDKFAEYLSIASFAVFFFLIAPILPRRPYLLHVLYYVLLGFFSVLTSKFLFYAFRFRLRAVDEILAPAEH